MKCRYGGANWVKHRLKQHGEQKPMSKLGVSVANLLGEWVKGIYHLNPTGLWNVDWLNEQHISITVNNSLATFDFDLMTKLVFLAHDFSIRCELKPKSSWEYYERDSDKIMGHHPTIEAALATHRERYTNDEAV